MGNVVRYTSKCLGQGTFNRIAFSPEVVNTLNFVEYKQNTLENSLSYQYKQLNRNNLTGKTPQQK